MKLETQQMSETKKQDIRAIINQPIDTQDLDRVEKKLKKNKTPGEDLIANEIFTKMSKKTKEKLAKVMEYCRQTSQFPGGWKETEIRWLYKKDDPLEIKNYRPIALTDTLYKIFTRIMTSRLEQAVEKYGIIADEQQGFQK